MHPKLPLLLLLLLAVAATASATAAEFDWGVGPLMAAVSKKKCEGSVGECEVGEDEELGLGAEEAGDHRRRLRGKSKRFISYDALKRNLVPCSKRGRSYYNCQSQGNANPYDRGCTAITRCARDTG